LELVRVAFDVAPAGRVPAGLTEIPFEFVLPAEQTAEPGRGLHESYRGVYVTVRYLLRAGLARALLRR
ncbi:unnamed protein product, partial [Heterosigma akashiwo]